MDERRFPPFTLYVSLLVLSERTVRSRIEHFYVSVNVSTQYIHTSNGLPMKIHSEYIYLICFHTYHIYCHSYAFKQCPDYFYYHFCSFLWHACRLQYNRNHFQCPPTERRFKFELENLYKITCNLMNLNLVNVNENNDTAMTSENDNHT